MKKIHKISILICFIFLAQACNILDQEPIDAVSNQRLFTRGSDAEPAIIGAYEAAARLGQNYVLMAEIPTKNIVGNALNRQFEQMNNLLFLDDNGFYNNLWRENYLLISRVNVIISRVPGIEDLSTENKNRVLAEARFLRAFAYFNLVRYFGNVPLITEPTTTADLVSLQVSRDPTEKVYEQIFSDLEFAKQNLPDNFSGTLATKARATKAAAFALATRIHLFRKEYSQVLSNSEQVISLRGRSLTNSYQSLYADRNTDEAIWEINYDNIVTNTMARTFLPGALGGVRMLEVNPDIISAYEAGDLRKNVTIGMQAGQPFVNKYTRANSGSDNIIVFRLAEVLLSRAEALAETSFPSSEATELLNEIRRRAGLSPVSLNEKNAFINQLYKDRRLELCYEGHEWFDLVRTDRLGSVLGITDPNKRIWPIPAVELLRNPNLLPQNPGY
ncbi:RagB/SusD family nutrient uptake outer membrane protein [Cecembia calidifontis]|uniref:RagB/SusD domain-containing protein n=1 Tax=Cecembia calidifontis TaxID=1187080 RepID=A0A4Q7PER1_9BACT|nr:RagB/SusD family nutrient uptake outer membrane protein [Cecembia calidifontis]RZS98288.1 RagB/SusD domain-containing protein [Cecembia calidifontis]